MNFWEIVKILSPIVVGLAAPFVTLKIWKLESRDKKEERADKQKEDSDLHQDQRIAALEKEVAKTTEAIEKLVAQTNENTEMNHRLINGMGVLIDSGEINGTINGPGKKWLRETQAYCINRGFQNIEFKSLSAKKAK